MNIYFIEQEVAWFIIPDVFSFSGSIPSPLKSPTSSTFKVLSLYS